MSIEIATSWKGTHSIIHVKGKFIYSTAHNDFKFAYESPKFVEATSRTLDLDGVNFIDSSGLAMLLEMRSFLGGDNANISISGLNTQTSRILNVAGFNRLFDLKES